METPEGIERVRIDKLLATSGWSLQNPREFNRRAALGVAVREFQLTTGPCDYLHFVGGQPRCRTGFSAQPAIARAGFTALEISEKPATDTSKRLLTELHKRHAGYRAVTENTLIS